MLPFQVLLSGHSSRLQAAIVSQISIQCNKVHQAEVKLQLHGESSYFFAFLVTVEAAD